MHRLQSFSTLHRPLCCLHHIRSPSVRYSAEKFAHSKSLQHDMKFCFHQMKADLQDLWGQSGAYRRQDVRLCEIPQFLVDAHSVQGEIIWLKSKSEDLEDRSRRNNLKIWISIQQVQLPSICARPLSSYYILTHVIGFNYRSDPQGP